MLEKSAAETSTTDLRKIAKDCLIRYAKDGSQTIRETYLFEKEHYAGVRFTMGHFRFQWNRSETHASISRENLVLETVNVSGETEIRRAA